MPNLRVQTAASCLANITQIFLKRKDLARGLAVCSERRSLAASPRSTEGIRCIDELSRLIWLY